MTDGTEPIAPSPEGRVYKNHYSSVIQSMLSIILVLALMYMIWRMQWTEGEGVPRPLLYLLGIALVGYLYIVLRIWLKTTYDFGPNELTVTKDTLFKKVTNIQYSRMASVNVRRSIVNHIFGTTTLLFNVNSSVNSSRAEAMLTLPSEQADELREFVSSRIFQKEMVVEVEKEKPTLVHISNMDVIMHGFFGQPTSTSLVGLASLAYSIITLFTNSGGTLLAIVIFALSTAVPWVRTILRYYNYRVYRVDDTITVESGLISNYRSSFKIGKINSVRIREPLMARLMGKAMLEAEVVGLADQGGLPLLCPLKGKRVVLGLADRLVPEFLIGEYDLGQPRQAAVPTMLRRIVPSLVSVAIGAALFLAMERNGYYNDIMRYVTYAATAVLIIAVPAVLLAHGMLAQGRRGFAMGEETFMFVIGAYDLETDFIRYDKVQTATVSSGIVQRRFGVSQCTVSMMSSMGAKVIRSGTFMNEDLERVSAEVMARIRDGRYDYRRYL